MLYYISIGKIDASVAGNSVEQHNAETAAVRQNKKFALA